jgi:hypothetical protein
VLQKDTAWCDDPSRDARATALQKTSSLDWISPDPCGGRDDDRRLDPGLVKAIVDAKDAATRIKASGIRIIGAAFCAGEVELSDIDVAYSIVLDVA